MTERKSDTRECGVGRAKVRIVKMDSEGNIISIEEYYGNVFLTCGVQTIWNIIAQNITSWTLGICVGDGSASASASQTCLQGSNQACSNASSVSVSNNQLSVTVTFGTNQANFTWNEIGVAFTNLTCPNCSYALIDRLVTAMGVKQPGTIWQVTMTLTIS
jgi:hypothetical protein